MSEPGSYPPPYQPEGGAYQAPFSSGSSLPAGTVAAVSASGLALLIGAARWLGAFLNANSDTFLTWPFATLPVVVEVGLAVAGFAVALVGITEPERRTHVAYLLAAATAAVLGFALNDGLYQLITLSI